MFSWCDGGSLAGQHMHLLELDVSGVSKYKQQHGAITPPEILDILQIDG